MISLLKKYYQVIKFKIFNNKLSIITNLLHEINYILSIFFFKAKSNYIEKKIIESISLKKKGFIILKDEDKELLNNLKELSFLISNSFDKKKNLIYNNDNVSYLNPFFLDQQKLKKVFTPKIINCIENYYNSSFQIYSYHIYRTDFSKKNDTDSYLWHTDNSTRHSLKLMFYLDDIKKDEGAMEIINYKNSSEIFKKGFYDRSQQNDYKDIINKDVNICEGNLGSVIIFKNSHNLHRAKKPLYKKRDVININIFPSIRKFQNTLKKNLNSKFYNSGFSINPFTNKPQNILKNEKL
jgi:hypothetical protein